MLEYFTIKKVKKHKGEKAEKEKQEKDKEAALKAAKDEAATSSSTPKIVSKPQPDDAKLSSGGTPLLDDEDEKFLEHLTSHDATPDANDDDEGTPPPLPPRVKTPVIDIESDVSSIASKQDEDAQPEHKSKDKKGKGKEEPTIEKPNKRFSFVTNLSRNISLRRSKPAAAGLHPDHLAVPPTEAKHEKADMAKVLDDLDLSATNNRAFSLSQESAEMVRKFTQVLKDLVNGVPTAYDDLVKLIEDRDGLIARNYEKLPNSLKKLVAQLPEKLTGSLAPELLAVAAQTQGIAVAEAEGATLKGAAKSLLTPGNLKDLVTKPGAVAGLLKGIVNALKTRFPAFIGTNVLWSLAVFLLLSMLWYCYKRGREVRLEQEGKDKEKEGAEGETNDELIDGKPRVEELPDDPLLTGPEGAEGKGKGKEKETIGDDDVKGKGKGKEKEVVNETAE